MLAWLPDPFAVLRDLTAGAGQWTYLLVAVVVLLETAVGLGILAPGEALLAVAGAASAGGGPLDLALVLLVVWVAGMVGDGCSFRLGRRHGPALLRRLRIPEARVDRVHALLAARGGAVLVGGRFVGPVRVLAPFLAGSSRMPARRFLAWDAAGVALWGWSYVLVGYAFAGSAGGASSTLGRAGAVAVCSATALIALALWLRRRRAAALTLE